MGKSTKKAAKKKKEKKEKKERKGKRRKKEKEKKERKDRKEKKERKHKKGKRRKEKTSKRKERKTDQSTRRSEHESGRRKAQAPASESAASNPEPSSSENEPSEVVPSSSTPEGSGRLSTTTGSTYEERPRRAMQQRTSSDSDASPPPTRSGYFRAPSVTEPEEPEVHTVATTEAALRDMGFDAALVRAAVTSLERSGAELNHSSVLDEIQRLDSSRPADAATVSVPTTTAGNAPVLPSASVIITSEPPRPAPSRAAAEESMCCICMDAPTTHVLVPCGHCCVCERCSDSGRIDECPLCREDVEKIIKLFRT